MIDKKVFGILHALNSNIGIDVTKPEKRYMGDCRYKIMHNVSMWTTCTPSHTHTQHQAIYSEIYRYMVGTTVLFMLLVQTLIYNVAMDNVIHTSQWSNSRVVCSHEPVLSPWEKTSWLEAEWLPDAHLRHCSAGEGRREGKRGKEGEGGSTCTCAGTPFTTHTHSVYMYMYTTTPLPSVWTPAEVGQRAERRSQWCAAPELAHRGGLPPHSPHSCPPQEHYWRTT